MAEVRCRSVGWDNNERRLDDLIILSCPSRQEPSKQSPAFDYFGVLSGRSRQIMDTGSTHNLLD